MTKLFVGLIIAVFSVPALAGIVYGPSFQGYRVTYVKAKAVKLFLSTDAFIYDDCNSLALFADFISLPEREGVPEYLVTALIDQTQMHCELKPPKLQTVTTTVDIPAKNGQVDWFVLIPVGVRVKSLPVY